MKVTLKGIDKVDKKIQNNIKLEAVKKIVKLNGAELQARSMRMAPVDTGQLKRSITLNTTDLTATVRPETDYAAYVEWGTRFMNAQPYLRPSFNVQKQIFIEDLKSLVQ